MTVFHISPDHYRSAIASEGLDPDKCREPRGRVWFYTNEEQAKAHAGWPGGSDVWALDDDLFIEREARWDTPWDDRACYVTVIVPPDLLRRLEPEL